MTPTRPPIVFISYSHDTPSHVERVLALATRLGREFAERLTPPEETPDLRRACAARLLAAYEDATLLEDHCARRGVDALQADLRAALALLPLSPLPVSGEGRGGRGVREEGLPSRLSSLLRLIQREAHVLRGWDPETRPALFSQQVRKRAIYRGMEALATRAWSCAGAPGARQARWSAL